MRGKLEDAEAAINAIRSAGIPVRERAYGFALDHPDCASEHSFAECGCEHDGSISLAVRADELPPIVHFFRFDMHEMAAFIVEAYQRAGVDADSESLLWSFRELEASYDQAALDVRLAQWQTEFDRQRRPPQP